MTIFGATRRHAIPRRLTPRATLVASAMVALFGSPLVVSAFTVSLLNLVGIYALATLGLILLTGSGGVTSFAQAAFMGVGAYTSVYVTTVLGLDPWVGLLAALLLVALCAGLMGVVTLHLGGHYLPITTLAWAVAISILFGTFTVLGAHSGIGDIRPISVGPVVLDRPQRAFYLVWTILVLALFGAANLLSSRQGRAVGALRGGPVLAESLGINPFWLRLQLFLLAAELACVAGWLFAHTQNFISPSSFNLDVGLQILLMTVLGGVGSVFSAVVGSAIVTLGRNWIQDLLPSLGLEAGTLEIIVFGVVFILLIHYFPRGLSPIIARLLPAVARPNLPSSAEGDQLDFSRASQADHADGPILELSNISKRFGGLVAVNQLSLAMRSRTVLALIGPNGAGKSTTFDLISGLKIPTEGLVRFMDGPLTGVAAYHVIKRGLSRTFQHVRLRPHATLLDNVMMGSHWRMKAGMLAGVLHLDREEERAYRRIALLALEEVGLADDPFALAGSLALGQQRLLEIARALAADPILIILDEPAAGLRAQEKQALGVLLRHLRSQGISILLVEHDMEFVMGLADEIVVLDFGRNLATGRPEQIRNDPRVQEAYLGGVD